MLRRPPSPTRTNPLFPYTTLFRSRTSTALSRLVSEAAVRVAIDLPSGVATDDGGILSPVPGYDLTVTFAARKPSHLLQPAARHMGRIAVADIGIEATSDLRLIERSEEHTSELPSLMRISYAVFCLKKKTIQSTYT